MNYKIYITKTSIFTSYYYLDFEDVFNHRSSFTLCINEFAFYTASVGDIVYKQFKKRNLYYE